MFKSHQKSLPSPFVAFKTHHLMKQAIDKKAFSYLIQTFIRLMRRVQLLTFRFAWGKPRLLKPSSATWELQPHGFLLPRVGTVPPLEAQAQKHLMQFLPSTGFWCGFSTIRCSDTHFSQAKWPNARNLMLRVRRDVTGLTGGINAAERLQRGCPSTEAQMQCFSNLSWCHATCTFICQHRSSATRSWVHIHACPIFRKFVI